MCRLEGDLAVEAPVGLLGLCRAQHREATIAGASINVLQQALRGLEAVHGHDMAEVARKAADFHVVWL